MAQADLQDVQKDNTPEKNCEEDEDGEGKEVGDEVEAEAEDKEKKSKSKAKPVSPQLARILVSHQLNT